jgi:hypothetical protein
MEFGSPTTTASHSSSCINSPDVVVDSMSPPTRTKGSAPSRPRKRKNDVAIGDVTPQPRKRKQLTAEEFRIRGKLDETWRKYIGHWRRFHVWLGKSEHKALRVPGHNLKTADVFESVFVPVPLDVFDQYIAFYGHKDDNLLKSKSTLDSFWAALVWVYDNHKPRIVVDEDLKARW